jgi:hypothetical protein
VRFKCDQAVSIVISYQSRKKSPKYFLFVVSNVKTMLKKGFSLNVWNTTAGNVVSGHTTLVVTSDQRLVKLCVDWMFPGTSWPEVWGFRCCGMLVFGRLLPSGSSVVRQAVRRPVSRVGFVLLAPQRLEWAKKPCAFIPREQSFTDSQYLRGSRCDCARPGGRILRDRMHKGKIGTMTRIRRLCRCSVLHTLRNSTHCAAMDVSKMRHINQEQRSSSFPFFTSLPESPLVEDFLIGTPDAQFVDIIHQNSSTVKNLYFCILSLKTAFDLLARDNKVCVKISRVYTFREIIRSVVSQRRCSQSLSVFDWG